MTRTLTAALLLALALTANAASNNCTVAWTWPTNDVTDGPVRGPLSGTVHVYVYDGVGVKITLYPVSSQGYPTNTTRDIYVEPGTSWATVSAISGFGDEGETAAALKIVRAAPGAPEMTNVVAVAK